MTGKEEVGWDGMPSAEGKCPVVGWIVAPPDSVGTVWLILRSLRG